MPLINTSIPNLAGGVSQQPASQRLPNQCEAQENALPLLVGGLTKRPPTNHIAEIKDSGGGSLNLTSTSVFTHVVTRDSQNEFLVTMTGTANAVHVTELDGAAKTVTADLGSSIYLTSTNPRADFRAVTIGDVTFLLNTSKTAAKNSTDTTPFSRNTEALETDGFVWIKQTGLGSVFKVTLKYKDYTGSEAEAWVKVTHTPQIQDLGSTTYQFTPSPPSAETICNVLVNGTDAVLDDEATNTSGTTLLASTGLTLSYLDGGGTEVIVTSSATFGGLNSLKGAFGADAEDVEALVDCGHVGSVIFLKALNDEITDPMVGGEFTLTGEDSFGGNGIAVIKDSVQRFSDVPPICKNNFILKVQGDPEDDIDDYYVKFETNGSADFGKGTWVEAVGPDLAYKWDYDTMPHILLRQSDGTFMVKRADGVTPGTAAPGADYSDFKFADRIAGDDLTNPFPSFEGNTISNIAFFRNRLAFLSGENVILSEAAEYFNFFRITVTQVLDSALIDVGVGGTEVNEVKEAVSFNDRLILFSERSQFALRGEGALTPLTATLNQVTNFDVTTAVLPVSAGRSLFFPFSRGKFSGIREFYKTSENDIQFDAVEVTAQSPKYIAGTVKKMTVSTHEDLVAVLSLTTDALSQLVPATDIYVYKFFNSGTSRVQSAWFKFTFSNCEIIDIHFVEQSLYIVMKRGSKTFLERMDLQNGLADSGSTYVTTIDRRILATAVADGYVLPFPADYEVIDGDTMEVVSEDGEVMTVESDTSTTITITERVLTGDKFYIGVSYTMLYELTKPILKTATPTGGYEAVASGRHQLRYMTIVYDETASFLVRVTPLIGGAEGTAIDYPFSGRFLSAGAFLGSVPSESGDFRFPVFSQSDSIKIEILNSSPLPSNIQSIEFEASYENRAKQRI